MRGRCRHGLPHKAISSAHLNIFSIQNEEEMNTVIDVVKLENLKEFLQKGLLEEINQIRENEKKRIELLT